MPAPRPSRNACTGPFGAAYETWIERERVAAVVGRLIWGIDTRRLYASIRAELAAASPGSLIVDVPCGGGVAFRALEPDRSVRYVAVDLDESMLARARRRAAAAGLDQIEFLAADMRDLPFEDDSIDLALAYSGLHMIPDPELAVTEIGRCLRPGGRVAGATFVAEGTRRQRFLFGQGARAGHAQPPPAAELERWMVSVGLSEVEIDVRAGFALFRARA